MCQLRRALPNTANTIDAICRARSGGTALPTGGTDRYEYLKEVVIGRSASELLPLQLDFDIGWGQGE